MPHEVQSSIPAHKSRTPKVEGVSKLPGARVTGAASRGRRLTWQRCGMGQRTHAAAWLFQWWERVPGRRINGSGPERAPCRWATPEHEQERDAGLQALSHWWLRETYCRILCQAPVKQVQKGIEATHTVQAEGVRRRRIPSCMVARDYHRKQRAPKR